MHYEKQVILYVLIVPSASGALYVWAEGPGSNEECAGPSLLSPPVPLHALPSRARVRGDGGPPSVHGVCVLSSPITHVKTTNMHFCLFLFCFILECSSFAPHSPFRFPADSNSQSVDRQFLWGSSLLISPVLEQGAVELSAYLPPATWYSLHDVSNSAACVTQLDLCRREALSLPFLTSPEGLH